MGTLGLRKCADTLVGGEKVLVAVVKQVKRSLRKCADTLVSGDKVLVA